MPLYDKPAISTWLAPARLYSLALTRAPSRSSGLDERSTELGRFTFGPGVDLARCGVILSQIWVATEPGLPARLFGGQLDISIFACQYRHLVEQEAALTIAMPPAFCSRSCKNALSDVCLEQCAIRRDGSCFDPKPHTDIDLPASRCESLWMSYHPRNGQSAWVSMLKR
jgi:hypothetical protein